MSILSNHATSSVVRVEGEIDINDLNRGDYSGEEVAKRMERASVLAQVDIHRAATHNKGVMNGIHAVVLATGNDTRGAEASAHAYAHAMVSIEVLLRGNMMKPEDVLWAQLKYR